MDRRERRRRAREREKLEERLRKEGLRLKTEVRAAASPADRFGLSLKAIFTSAKVIWSSCAVLLTILGGWALMRPGLSIEPYLSLSSGDPYATQFAVKNENSIFEARDINCVCWPRKMESGNGFSVLSFVPLPNMHHEIKLLQPGATSTVDCPAAIGGLGRWSGQVMYAELEILVSYHQSWSPFERSARYPFASRRDEQGAVHWTHITPQEEKALFPSESRKP